MHTTVSQNPPMPPKASIAPPAGKNRTLTTPVLQALTYRLTLNSHSQITLPKALRTALGLAKGQTVNLTQTAPDTVTLRPTKTVDDVLSALDDIRTSLPTDVKVAIQRNAGKTASQLRREADLANHYSNGVGHTVIPHHKDTIHYNHNNI